ncbi:HNH endonuclease [Nostoc commune]|nr:HNH endonuclease [Nostoc commune]
MKSHADYIISVKHSGATTPDNLCYACVLCNFQTKN